MDRQKTIASIFLHITRLCGKLSGQVKQVFHSLMSYLTFLTVWPLNWQSNRGCRGNSDKLGLGPFTYGFRVPGTCPIRNRQCLLHRCPLMFAWRDRSFPTALHTSCNSKHRTLHQVFAFDIHSSVFVYILVSHMYIYIYISS